MTKFFITRPIFASVLSIIIVLAGLAAAFKLPIAQYPQIAPPTVTITATYPGANPKTIAETVASPIEQIINGTENMLYMSSQSTANGVMTLTVTFKLVTQASSLSLTRRPGAPARRRRASCRSEGLPVARQWQY